MPYGADPPVTAGSGSGSGYGRDPVRSGAGTTQQRPAAPSLAEAITTGAQADALSAPSALPTAASVAQGVLNLPEGIAQSVGLNLPGPLESIRKEAQKAPMPGLGEMVGGLAAPWNWFFPEAELGTIARTALSGLRGGIGALFTPQKSAKEFWPDAWKRAAVGTAVGLPLGAISGPVSEDAQHLLDNGIRVTPMTAAGAGGAERITSAVPGFGEAVSHGSNVTLHDWNRRLYRWALDGLGAIADAPIQAGSRGLSYVFNQITQRLNRANAALELTPFMTPGFTREFNLAAQEAGARMSDAAFGQYTRAVVQFFREPVLSGNGRLAGPTLAKAISDFKGLAREQVSGDPDKLTADNYALARAYRDMAGVLQEFSTGPQWAKDLRDAANRAYAKYMVLESGAARSGVGSEGVITPRAFMAAEQKQIGRGRYQRDEIPFADSQAMKDLAETANRVIGPRGYGPAQRFVSPLVGLELYRTLGPAGFVKTLPALAAWWAAHTGPGMTAGSVAAQSGVRAGLPRAAAPAGAAVESELTPGGP